MRYYRAAAQIVELPDGPAPALIKPGTDVSATLTCHCGQELEAGWAYCPSCSLSTKALAASKEPSRADLVSAELQRQRDAHAAAFERPVTAWRISRAAGSCAASGAKRLSRLDDDGPAMLRARRADDEESRRRADDDQQLEGYDEDDLYKGPMARFPRQPNRSLWPSDRGACDFAAACDF